MSMFSTVWLEVLQKYIHCGDWNQRISNISFLFDITMLLVRHHFHKIDRILSDKNNNKEKGRRKGEGGRERRREGWREEGRMQLGGKEG